jgi:hypothetical protein
MWWRGRSRYRLGNGTHLRRRKSCVGVEAADLGGARRSVLLLVAIERGHDGVCCSEDGGDNDSEDGGEVAALRMEAGSSSKTGARGCADADLVRAWRV